jgi:Ca-activated chloride channel family protein
MKRRFLAVTMCLVMLTSVTGCGSRTENKIESPVETGIKADVDAQAETEGNPEVYEEAYENSDLAKYAGETNDVEYDGVVSAEAAYDTGTGDVYGGEYYEYDDFNTNEYDYYEENSWLSTKTSPLSTFAADVDTASYSNIRSYINSGYDIDPSMVRIEEMVNYFSYDYELPSDGDKFAVSTEYADCPWNADTKLARISLATEAIDFSDAPASNIVFLIDTSGSMFDSNKLPLVQQSLMMLAENFTEKDRISIVTYAGNSNVELSGVTGDKYYEICDAIEGLEAYGSTNGADGIETAYELAEKYFIKGGNNRVILATDGDLNVGLTSESELTRLIKEKKKSGVFFSVIGVGYGNYKDNKLEALADNGDGTYAYIDSIFEAKKTLVENLGASMTTVAKDVKLQVEFNPELVKGYRLIGYENRVMAAEDFDDDTKDGGEMGAGHTVTALYEIALTDSAFEISEPELKYDKSSNDKTAETISYVTASDGVNASSTDELFTLNVRYKEPDSDTSQLETYVCTTNDYSKNGSDNLRWAAAVAGFGLILRDSEYKGDADADNILNLAESALDNDDEYRQEFIELVKTYRDKYLIGVD